MCYVVHMVHTIKPEPYSKPETAVFFEYYCKSTGKVRVRVRVREHKEKHISSADTGTGTGAFLRMGTDNSTCTGYFKLQKYVDGYGLKLSRKSGTDTGAGTGEYLYWKYGYGFRTRLRTSGYGPYAYDAHIIFLFLSLNSISLLASRFLLLAHRCSSSLSAV